MTGPLVGWLVLMAKLDGVEMVFDPETHREVWRNPEVRQAVLSRAVDPWAQADGDRMPVPLWRGRELRKAVPEEPDHLKSPAKEEPET